jgi:hypothetical protein
MGIVIGGMANWMGVEVMATADMVATYIALPFLSIF